MKLDEKKVKQLIALMNANSEVKVPPLKPIIDCFEIGMDEQMLDYLLQVGTEMHSKEELRSIYDAMYPGENKWEELWGKISDMCFLFPAVSDHEKYELAYIFPGWIELGTSGPLNEKRAAILKRFTDFWDLLKTVNIPPVRMMMNYKGMKKRDTHAPHMSTYVSRGTKEITLNQPLTSEHQVRTAGEIYELLAQHKNQIAVMNCFCRQIKQVNGNGECEFKLPVEGCVSLGAISRLLVENGIARPLSYEEACSLMDEFEKKGCIHTTYHYGCNVSNDEMVICNCCKDCCLLYGGYQDGYISQIFVRAFYKPEMIDENKCVGCNKCGKFCPTDATYYDRKTKKLVFQYDRCIGCGQCVNQCKFDVRKMVADERNVFVTTKKR